LARRHERHSQRERKEPKEQERQTPTSLPAETSGISGQARRTDFPSFLPDEVFCQAQEIRNIWLQELYIFRLAAGKCSSSGVKHTNSFAPSKLPGYKSDSTTVSPQESSRSGMCRENCNNSQSRVAIFFFDTL
jgi:hypothetical protein